MTAQQKLMLAVVATVGLPMVARGQAISYDSAGSIYSQNFDTLQGTGTVGTQVTWTDGTAINGWYAASAPGGTPGPIATYRVSDGSINSGSVYSFGTLNTTDRALGSIGSGTPRTQWYGMKLTNNTGGALDQFTLSYTGEEWRQTTASANSLEFYYSTTATQVYDSQATIVDPAWNAAAALNFVAPMIAPDGAIDGNAAANRTALSATVNISGGWAAGGTLWVRWRDLDNTGSDQGLAVDDLTFSAAKVSGNKNAVLTVAPSVGDPTHKTADLIDLGRVVSGRDTVTANVTVSNTGTDDTTYSDLSTDGSTLVPSNGPVAHGGTATVGVKVSGGGTNFGMVGTDVNKTAILRNDGNTADGTISIPTKVHVVTDRFVNSVESSAGMDFGDVLVGASKTLTATLTTTNTSTPTDSNYLTVVKLPAATTANAATLNDAYAQVQMAAGTADQVFSDGTESTPRQITLTPLKSGKVVSGTVPGGQRQISYMPYTFLVIDNTAGATNIGRVYVRGNFWRPAAVTGDTTAVAPGGTVTLTNNVPTSGDGTAGQGMGAEVTGTSFDQSGWSVTGIGAGTALGATRARYVDAGTTYAAVFTTATGTIGFDPAGKLNGTYGGTLTVAMQNSQSAGVYGVAPNDLPAVQVPVSGTVSDKPANHPGSYSLNAGTLSAPATTLTGSFTQTGGQSTFAALAGKGTVAVSGGKLSFTAGAATANVVGSLAATGTGQVEIADTKLVIDYTGTSAAAAVRAMLQAGRSGGTWTGNGMISSVAAGDATATTGIGYLEASQLLSLGASATGVWNGQNVDGTSLLIGATKYGDLNLDGKVNADDFALADRGLARHLAAGTATWGDGDVNYDGLVSSADFLLIDKSFALGGGLLSAEFLAAREAQFGAGYVSQLVASVPEPTGLGLAVLAAAGLGARRRRR